MHWDVHPTTFIKKHHSPMHSCIDILVCHSSTQPYTHTPICPVPCSHALTHSLTLSHTRQPVAMQSQANRFTTTSIYLRTFTHTYAVDLTGTHGTVMPSQATNTGRDCSPLQVDPCSHICALYTPTPLQTRACMHSTCILLTLEPKKQQQLLHPYLYMYINQ